MQAPDVVKIYLYKILDVTIVGDWNNLLEGASGNSSIFGGINHVLEQRVYPSGEIYIRISLGRQ